MHVFRMIRQKGQKRKLYDPKKLDEAAELVKSKVLSLNKASNVYGIPKTTLHDRVCCYCF